MAVAGGYEIIFESLVSILVHTISASVASAHIVGRLLIAEFHRLAVIFESMRSIVILVFKPLAVVVTHQRIARLGKHLHVLLEDFCLHFGKPRLIDGTVISEPRPQTGFERLLIVIGRYRIGIALILLRRSKFFGLFRADKRIIAPEHHIAYHIETERIAGLSL